MEKKAEYEFRLPQFLICAIEYGADCTDNFTPEDTAALEAAMEMQREKIAENNGSLAVWTYSDEPAYFTWGPDFMAEGCHADILQIAWGRFPGIR
jgi:hypothetical protein